MVLLVVYERATYCIIYRNKTEQNTCKKRCNRNEKKRDVIMNKKLFIFLLEM